MWGQLKPWKNLFLGLDGASRDKFLELDFPGVNINLKTEWYIRIRSLGVQVSMLDFQDLHYFLAIKLLQYFSKKAFTIF